MTHTATTRTTGRLKSTLRGMLRKSKHSSQAEAYSTTVRA